MKKLTASMAMLFLLMIFTLTDVYAEGNLVKNPSFEEDAGGKPAAWMSDAWNKTAGTTDFRYEDGKGHTGSKFVTVENKKQNDGRYKQDIAVKENAIYKLSCWIKAENVGTVKKGANLSVEGKLDSSRDIKGTNSDWEYVEMYAKTTKGIKTMKVTVGIGGYSAENTGKASFDDVSVEEVSSVPGSAIVSTIGGEAPAQNNSSNKSPAQPLKDPGKAIWVLIIAAVVVIGGAIVYYGFINRKSRGDKQESEEKATSSINDESETFEDAFSDGTGNTADTDEEDNNKQDKDDLI